MLEKDASASRSLVIEKTLPHPPEKLWRALTGSALIADCIDAMAEVAGKLD